MRTTRALSYAAATLLLFAIFEGCTSNDDNVVQPNGPPSIAIASISLGHGHTGEGGATSTLVCDHTVGVTLTLTNWYLFPPGLCGQTPQCGQVRVSLLDHETGTELGSPQFAATLGVDLKLDDLLDLSTLNVKAQYDIQAELVNDSGDVFDASNGGNSKTHQTFFLAAIQDKGDCPELAVGAPGGAGGGGGAGGAGGDAGFGGMPDFGQAGAGEGGEGGAGGASAGAAGGPD